MRIWDIHPGYLNRHSLLGEHRELHGIVSIMVQGKKGYSKHPETRRWLDHGWALAMRHRLLAAEMALRNYTDRSPVELTANHGVWPGLYIGAPGEQFALLAGKYAGKEQGRIPLPGNAQQVWSQHKYSILARNVPLYQQIGRELATTPAATSFTSLAALLTEHLRTPPTAGGIRNALLHMWGYVSEATDLKPQVETWPLPTLLRAVQQGALATRQPYLLASTALSELEVWIASV